MDTARLACHRESPRSQSIVSIVSSVVRTMTTRETLASCALRVAQCDVHRSGWVVADRVGAGQGRACLGRGGEGVSGPDRSLRCGCSRARQSARSPSRATADGEAAARDGRCPSARAEGATGTGTEPIDVRTVAGAVHGPQSTVHSQGRRTSALTGKTIFCNSGFEAVEAALKTAMLATGKPGVIAFEGAYHGLGYGALNVTQREHFRGSFRRQLREFGHFVPFPKPARRTGGLRSRRVLHWTQSRPRFASFSGRRESARCWWNPFRRAAASTCRRRASCPCCAGFATSTRRC